MEEGFYVFQYHNSTYKTVFQIDEDGLVHSIGNDESVHFDELIDVGSFIRKIDL